MKYNKRHSIKESDYESEYKTMYQEYLKNFHSGYENFKLWIDSASDVDFTILKTIAEEKNISSDLDLKTWYNALLENNII